MGGPAIEGSNHIYNAPQRGDYQYPSPAMTCGQRPDVVPENPIEPVGHFHESASPRTTSEFDNESGDTSTLNQASHNSASSVSTSQHYSRYSSSISSSYRESNRVVTRGVTEHSSYISESSNVTASPSLSRRNKPPPNRQTSGIKNQSIDSIGSDYSSMSNKGAASIIGTPSRLSVGRGSGSGWNTPTAGNTWNTEGTPSYTASSLSGGASMGDTGPSAGVGQSSLDDVCDDTLPIEP